jgi:epsilon-lactone hydrolase
MNLPHRLFLHLAAAGVMTVLSVQHGFAQSAVPIPREVPARILPVPTTVSPQMQKIIGAPISPTWNVFPKTAEEWKTQVNGAAAEAIRALPAMRDQLRVKSEPVTVDGVKSFTYAGCHPA